MIITYQSEGFIILDDVLSPKDHQVVWNYIQDENFEFVHSKNFVKAFRLHDGEPLRAQPILSDFYEPDKICTVYPSGRGIDLVIQAIKNNLSLLEKWVGKKDVDWSYFFARAYLYPANTGLSWHRDNQKSVTGAFVYYAHPQWNVQWGGEFLISNPSTKNLQFPSSELYGGEKKFLGSYLDNTYENEALLDEGFGHYVHPKPNRLVIITSGILHTIKRVDPAAGSHVRATIQGFFQDPAGILKKNH